METYVLIVLVALFLGVMGIIAMMERRRRTELAKTEQLHQTLTACVGWLQAIHSSDEAQMGKVAEALAQLRTAVETGTKSSSESAASLSSETLRAVEKAASRLETVVQQHQKALDTTMIRAADKLSESSAARTKELLSEAQRMCFTRKQNKTPCWSESIQFWISFLLLVTGVCQRLRSTSISAAILNLHLLPANNFTMTTVGCG